MDLLSGKTKNQMSKLVVKKMWGPRRELPQMAEKSFNQLWKEKHEEGKNKA